MNFPWGELFKRITHYVRLQLLGVLVPGFLILSELMYWTLPANRRGSFTGALQYVSSQSSRLNTVVEVGTAFLALFVAYVLGFILRQTVWRIVLWRLKDPLWTNVRSNLSELYSVGSIDSVIEAHPALMRAGGPTTTGIRRYAKVWLQLREPRLSVDFLEAEINILFAYIPPFALGPFIVFDVALGSHLAYLIAAPLTSAFFVAILAFAAKRLRFDTEPFETILNFLFAHWIRSEEPLPTREEVGAEAAEGGR
jgi:hypothetical protein